MGKRKVQNKPSQTAPSAEGGEDKKEESKTKGKKTYSLQQQKGAAAQSGDAETSELPKVRLPDKLESALIEQIGEEQRSRQGQRDVSKRLTSKKLTDVYDSLLGTGFSRTQVEAAMSNCIMGGGDLIDALDWLCLNTQNDQLPAGFSETLQKEEEKRRPKFDLSLHEEKDLRLVASQDSGGEKGETSSGGKSTRSETPSAKTDKGGGGGGMKNWILQYAEQSSEEEEEEEDEGGDASSFNPTKRYADLHRQLQEVKSQAAIAKSSGATEKHKTLSKQLKEMHIGTTRMMIFSFV
ncbi:ATP-dependent RNA helicase dhx29 [Aplysia californica]|uniref:ATP-dependent RNA helicase dhx29 n=1 Tax=Aplysia californica TaxID=6500 RepID=A0ABM1AED9_APLCA|nr:ATP-dependent RNA helicase dhx29 [Aplysia californica]